VSGRGKRQGDVPRPSGLTFRREKYLPEGIFSGGEKNIREKERQPLRIREIEGANNNGGGRRRGQEKKVKKTPMLYHDELTMRPGQKPRKTTGGRRTGVNVGCSDYFGKKKNNYWDRKPTRMMKREDVVP